VTNRLVGEALEKSFARQKVIKGVSLEMSQGQIHALMGKNGAGKTTLLRILAGLMRPDEGTVRFLQNEVAADARPHLGVVLHSAMLYPDLTVFENLRFFAELYRVANAAERVEETLQQVHLLDQRSQVVHTLSRGMIQRLAIARALLHEPQLLLLDEPFSGLDEASCETVETLLQEFRLNQRSVLFVAHDFETVARVADKCSFLANGKIDCTCSLQGVSGETLRNKYREICGERGE
jgi:heme exporter protein A